MAELPRRSRVRLPRRILLLEFGHIGDGILSLPLIAALQSGPGQPEVAVVGGPWLREALALAPRPVEFFSAMHLFAWRTPVSPWTRIRGFLRLVSWVRSDRHDVVIDVRGTLASALVALSSRCAWRVGCDPGALGLPFDRLVANEPVCPEAERKLRFAAAVSSGTKAADGVAVSEAGRRVDWLRQHGLGDPYIVVHTRAPWVPRNWPAERRRELMRRLVARHPVAILLVGSAEDSAEADTLRAGMENRIVNACGRLDLALLAQLCAGARLFVGTDSAPAHLAAAVGATMVILLGPAEYPRFAPSGVNARIKLIRHAVCPHQKANDCQQTPGALRCANGENICMQAISVDEVLVACETLLSWAKPSMAHG